MLCHAFFPAGPDFWSTLFWLTSTAWSGVPDADEVGESLAVRCCKAEEGTSDVLTTTFSSSPLPAIWTASTAEGQLAAKSAAQPSMSLQNEPERTTPDQITKIALSKDEQ